MMLYTSEVHHGENATYLTDEERAGLAAVAKSTGKKQSELIREAVDQFLDAARGDRRTAVLREAAGLCQTRDDLPDFAAERRSLDRG
jgi:predicted DNA-binding protein